MEVDMTDVGVALIRMQRDVGMREITSLIRVLIEMRRTAVTVRVEVHCVAVVVVSGTIRVGNIGVILISRIRVIAMAGIQVIDVGHIQVVVMRDGIITVVVITMAHIPVVRVRWVLRRGIQMARAGLVGMIKVRDGVGVVRMERCIQVIGMP
jgi:hypothetical protein